MSTVAFWSPLQGGSGSTAHTAAVASCIGMDYRLRMLLGHGGMAGERIEGAFPANRTTMDSLLSFQDQGMDALERLCVNRRLNRDNFRDYTISLLPERLDIVTGNGKKEGTMPGYRPQLLNTIMTVANQYYDLVAMDAGCGCDGSRHPGDQALLDSADLVVVSLTQSIQGLEEFFTGENVPGVLKDKPYMIVMGRYDRDSHCTLQNVKRRFGFKGSIHGIPYSTDFMDAWNMHGVMSYMQRSRNLNARHPSSKFYESIRGLSKDILNTLDIPTAVKAVERGA
ncbi:hypothetical protein [Paenibacillus pini]|uniref:Cellulose biosynthesis protein BcsQ n=1 Tax=Paenibacillus pini JCM 16418 TaxID=1236976 RepID=W7Y972_9BACL|nr:hypothetical protein [Paenibacillus pini]GAF07535.1 hypothetical protein JCM16418_1553 [Paenibacillus pini JCM 16418]